MKHKPRAFGRAISLMLALIMTLAFVPQFAAASEETWAIYWYLCGSDLESGGGLATVDLSEMLQVELPDNMVVVIQAGGADEWQNDFMDPSMMYRMQYAGDELSVVESFETESMGDPGTLAGFLEFCEENYEADRKALIFWNHGGGSGSGICYDEIFDDDYLSLAELQETFDYVYGEPGEVMPFELIGFDACVMATIDTASVCSGYANYMVASEEIEPGCGWKYDGFLGALSENTAMDGAELGTAICDSYYEGCEEIGREGIITLSTIDLSQVSEVVFALNVLSAEGITVALEGSPSSFFADYGRGANKAEYYADGSAEMVDLVSLVEENRHLFPETADYLLESVENCVVYQRTGAYRSDSHGISAYFPYNMDREQYENFFDSAASPAMSYMYQFLMEGTFSQEAVDYFTDEENFEEAVLETDYEFADVSEYGLEDHPIDVIEEGDYTYAQLNLGAEAAESLQRVTFMLALLSDDGEEAVILGEEYDLVSDWENGIFTDSFRGVWGAIDDNLVMMEVSSVTDEYILYDVPILLNGENCSLSVAYSFEDEEYRILTARPESEDGILSKVQYLLVPGDEVTTLLYYLDDSNEDYFENETFTVTEDTVFHETDLPDGIYSFLYVMTDYINDTYMSDVIGVTITDGEPVMFGLDD